MSYIQLGNINTPELCEKFTGYRIPKEFHQEWKELYSEKANIEGDGFHIFHMPLQIDFKGDKALNFIKKVFVADNLMEAKGRFGVVRQE